MSHDARAASIKNFEEKAEVRILLASLKCGGGKFPSLFGHINISADNVQSV